MVECCFLAQSLICSFGLCSASLLIRAGVTFLGMVLPTVDWDLSHPSLIKIISHRHGHGPNLISAVLHLSLLLMTLDCVKLIAEANQDKYNGKERQHSQFSVQSNNMNTIKKSQTEILVIKIIISEMRNSFGRFVSKVDSAEQSVSMKVGHVQTHV